MSITHARDLKKTWCGLKYTAYDPRPYHAVWVSNSDRKFLKVTCKRCRRALTALRTSDERKDTD